MINEQNDIREFMVKAQQATPDRPEMPPEHVRALRLKLIAEELCELARAYGFEMHIDTTLSNDPALKPDLVESFDGIIDLMVVVIGSGVASGLPLAEGWAEVHRSNMSKFIDGHRREDGKWIKGPSYTPANLAPIIEKALTK